MNEILKPTDLKCEDYANRQKAKSILHIAPHSNGPDAFTIESPCPMPSRWVRFWYWALLGWTWDHVEKRP